MQLVSDLLTTAADRQRVQPVPTDLAALIHSGMELAAPKAADGVGIAAELPGRLQAIVNPHRMGQVQANLMTNAIKFSPGGSVSVRAEVGPGNIRIEVADTGIDIAAAEQQEVFGR